MKSPAAAKPTPQYVSGRDLAGLYGVSVMTIWRWSKAGRIPAPLRLGENTSRWNLAEVEAALMKAAQEQAGMKTPGWVAAKAAKAAQAQEERDANDGLGDAR